MDSVKLYERLRSRAKTENQLSGCLNKLEDILDPEEIFAIARWTKKNPAPPTIVKRERQWRRTNARLKIRIPRFAIYERKQSRFSHSLYVRKGAFSQPNLLICFSGRMNRPMMPAWMFLACLPPSVTHVSIIRGTWFNEMRESTYAKDADKILVYIHDLLNELKPKHHWIIGTSGGTLPALIFSQKVNPDKVLLCGMPSLDDATWSSDFKLKDQTDASNIWFVYGSEDSSPKKVLPAFQARFPLAKIVKVRWAQHSVLANLFFRSRLNSFMKKAFREG